jgi:hypothetical protein
MRCVGIAASWQVADDQDGIYLRAERDSLAELDGLREMVLQLPRSGKKDEGRELLLTAQPVLTRLIGAVDAHQKYNTDLGTQGSKAAEKTRREALIVSCTMGLVLLGVLLCSGSRTLGWLLRTLGGEPGEVAAVAHAVAGGNLSSQMTLQPGDTASLEETASSMEEMTSTVKQNAGNAAQANQLAAAARAQAEKGGGVVSDAVAAMGGLAERCAGGGSGLGGRVAQRGSAVARSDDGELSDFRERVLWRHYSGGGSSALEAPAGGEGWTGRAT